MPLLLSPHLFKLLLRISALERLDTAYQLSDRMRVVRDLIQPRHDLLRPQHTQRAQMISQHAFTDLAQDCLGELPGFPPRRVRIENSVDEATGEQSVEGNLLGHEESLLGQACSHTVDHGPRGGAFDYDADRIEGREEVSVWCGVDEVCV